MLVALEGLFDTGEAATEAMSWIRSRGESELMATIDPERFFDFQQVRPVVGFDEDGNRSIDWPTTDVWACKTDASRDLIVIDGVEPNLRWRDYSAQLLRVAREARAEMVITVGAMPAAVAHTKHLDVTGSAADPELARRLRLKQPSYQGPTGVMGVVNHELHTSGMPIISVRVDVPHYVPSPPSPKATMALLKRIEDVTSVETGWQSLEPAVSEWVERVNEAVNSDPGNQAYVAQLEQEGAQREERAIENTDVAAEVEDFLRSLRPTDEGETDEGDVQDDD